MLVHFIEGKMGCALDLWVLEALTDSVEYVLGVQSSSVGDLVDHDGWHEVWTSENPLDGVFVEELVVVIVLVEGVEDAVLGLDVVKAEIFVDHLGAFFGEISIAGIMSLGDVLPPFLWVLCEEAFLSEILIDDLLS